MKYYQPLRVQPNTNQFYSFINDRLSPTGAESMAYSAVFHLFQLAEGFYKSLDHHTSQQLATFVDAGKYLTPIQEHDLIGLTAIYMEEIDTTTIAKIIDSDQILDTDLSILQVALELFKSTAIASRSAVGQPCWVE